MLIVRLALPGSDFPWFGRVRSDRPDEVELLSGSPFLSGSLATAEPTGQHLPFQPAKWQAEPDAGPRLLFPVVPGKIVGVGSNYHDHTVEMGKPIPDEPVLFLKPPSALLDPGLPIVRPLGWQRVDFEGELAVVIGQRARRISEKQAREHIFGYTALNDVTVRDLQRRDGQFTRGKGFDTFCPLGPAISTDVDPEHFHLTTRLNGRTVQDSRTDRFLFPVYLLVSLISQVMTLFPGDVITTGTPAGVANLTPGDVVEIEIAGLPALRNPVVAGPEFLGGKPPK
jgi:2-keto-4-pentenoate hydratase/2-oxohepta-3-ene-1,7-dioic acid hydratase in catechol pathway